MASISAKYKPKGKITVSTVLLTLLFVVVGLTMLVPLIWMISASMKPEADVFNFPIEWIPRRWSAVENYRTVWGGEYNFGKYYWNSIKIAVGATALQVFFSALGAYGFSKVQWKGRDLLFTIYLATMMIPEQVTIVSRFLITRELGLYNTHLGLILMLSFSVYGVFLLKQTMSAIPESLSESARMDGANHWQIFSRVILPITQPTLATLAILKFTWTWNDYQHPLIFITNPELYTVQQGMQMFATQSGVYYSLTMAAAVSSILPLLIIFLIGQKYIIGGISAGAVKG